jgi:riboflavin kinase/FMN adenylyltransferase
VETHILGFYEDLYGMELDVIFHQRLRDEKAFNSLDKLKEAISDDVAKAEEFFSVRS